MDKETIRYIINYFNSLLTDEESLAIKYTHSLLKLEHLNRNYAIEDQITQIYRKRGWITKDESILDLLKDGYDNFELKTAQQILSEYPDRVFLNNCPKRNKLTRTPYAKQCRYCGHDWHNQ